MNHCFWRLIEDGLCAGDLNMATDLALLKSCEKGDTPPTLRLYGWKTPTLSLGRFQDASRDVNMARCRAMGIPVVRRPTGGKAVLHVMEATYSVVAPTAHANFSRGIRNTLKTIGKALLVGLEEMEISGAVLNDCKKNMSSGKPSVASACFASLNHFEILVEGKKLAGSAQKRTRKAFLQHGSVLIDFDPELILSLLNSDDSVPPQNYLDILKKSAIGLNKIKGEEISYLKTAHALRGGFQKAFPGDWKEGKLSCEEEELRDRLIRSVIL